MKARTYICWQDHRALWVVTLRHVFASRKTLASAYSRVRCDACDRTWRTRAAYVEKLPDAERTPS